MAFVDKEELFVSTCTGIYLVNTNEKLDIGARIECKDIRHYLPGISSIISLCSDYAVIKPYLLSYKLSSSISDVKCLSLFCETKEAVMLKLWIPLLPETFDFFRDSVHEQPQTTVVPPDVVFSTPRSCPVLIPPSMTTSLDQHPFFISLLHPHVGYILKITPSLENNCFIISTSDGLVESVRFSLLNEREIEDYIQSLTQQSKKIGTDKAKEKAYSTPSMKSRRFMP
ncbi:hypothetical protein ADUPG1_009483 [Aduncisulcus paluster]|uniref:Uncharacterized protein n=1 Tax=Aduncisulcus paluster TaxID=2918883 RepID=A0ABQ5KVP3_9EUKA|nr:hypothetical protein ADUPG1_009483 [Aduncisulcus paluster]